MPVSDIQSGYDLVAKDYAAQFCGELDHKPFDRKMLDWLIEKAGGDATICDLGCGPGQVAAFLHARGARASGIDLSPEMVRQARELNPEIPFEQGDMLDLAGVAAGAFGGIAAFYSIIHVPRDRAADALQELKRVLKPGGVLLLSFHIGKETIHKEEWWGKAVSMDFFFYETAEMKAHLQTAGFRIEEAIERDPYAEIEYPSRRAYIFARV